MTCEFSDINANESLENGHVTSYLPCHRLQGEGTNGLTYIYNFIIIL